MAHQMSHLGESVVRHLSGSRHNEILLLDTRTKNVHNDGKSDELAYDAQSAKSNGFRGFANFNLLYPAVYSYIG